MVVERQTAPGRKPVFPCDLFQCNHFCCCPVPLRFGTGLNVFSNENKYCGGVCGKTLGCELKVNRVCTDIISNARP